MQIRKSTMIGIFFFVLALLSSSVQATEQKITLKAGPHGTGANGEAVIKDKEQGQKEIIISVSGLKPSSVYTVWLVNMKPKMDMAGVGGGDYSFKSDDKGNGHYAGTVPSAELEKWQVLEIAHHPDGDPKNMKKMGIALQTNLK